MESQSRRNNLVLDGVPDSENETDEECREKALKILADTMKVENVRNFQFVRIHRYKGQFKPTATRSHPIMFKLHYYTDVEAIWNKRRELKGQNIWLQQDFPEAIKQRRRILNPVAKAAREKGKKAFLTKDNLILDDKLYTVKTLYQLPRDLQPATLSQKTDSEKKYTAFYSSSSPLSNHHFAEFTDENGVPFHSSEQKYQHGKALEFNDNTAARNILSASTAYECYRFGQNILGYNDNQWRKVAREHMFKACKAKFDQNPILMSYLRDTKDSKLVEANPNDTLWSCGLSLSDKNLFDETAWKGPNWLGEILTTIRDT